MRLKNALDDILGNKKRVNILRTLFRYPGEFTGRHIARLCNLSQASVQIHLEALADSDILKINYVGKSRIFSLNKENVLFQPLKDLFQVEEKLIPQLTDSIRDFIKGNPELQESLLSASIYGSILTTEARPDSDIDVLLVIKDKNDKEISEEQFSELEAKIYKLFGNRFHFFITNINELSELKESNKAIFHSLKFAYLAYGTEIQKLLR